MSAQALRDVAVVVVALAVLVENVALSMLVKSIERRSDSPKDRQGFTCRKCHGILLSSGVKPGDDLCAACRADDAVRELVIIKAYVELTPDSTEEQFTEFFTDLVDSMSETSKRHGFELGLVTTMPIVPEEKEDA